MIFNASDVRFGYILQKPLMIECYHTVQVHVSGAINITDTNLKALIHMLAPCCIYCMISHHQTDNQTYRQG